LNLHFPCGRNFFRTRRKNGGISRIKSLQTFYLFLFMQPLHFFMKRYATDCASFDSKEGPWDEEAEGFVADDGTGPRLGTACGMRSPGGGNRRRGRRKRREAGEAGGLGEQRPDSAEKHAEAGQGV